MSGIFFPLCLPQNIPSWYKMGSFNLWGEFSRAYGGHCDLRYIYLDVHSLWPCFASHHVQCFDSSCFLPNKASCVYWKCDLYFFFLIRLMCCMSWKHLLSMFMVHAVARVCEIDDVISLKLNLGRLWFWLFRAHVWAVHHLIGCAIESFQRNE